MEMESDYDFTLAEAIDMKKLYDKLGKDCPDAPYYEELADKFNNSIHRCGKSVVKWEQVYDWFQDLRSWELLTQMKSVEPTVMEVDTASDERISDKRVSVVKASEERVSDGNGKELEYQLPNNVSSRAIRSYRKTKDRMVSVGNGKELKHQLANNGSSPAIQSYHKTKAVAAEELSNLLYEAKSSWDHAWYDVGSFLSYRYTTSGELEAQVRFVNYGKDKAEWLNVKKSIRQRSVCLRAEDCEKVKIGDLVLCFRKSEVDEVYRDAHVLGIERNKHSETEGCTCIFVVQYDTDFFEDRVRLSKLCVRPTF